MSTHNMFLWRNKNKIFILIPFNLELHKLWHFLPYNMGNEEFDN